MDIQERIKHMGQPLLALTIITAVLAVGGIATSIAPAADGEAYGYTRIALGLVGVAGAALVMFGRDYGKLGLMAIMAWAAVQSVFYATVPDGNYTRQIFDGLLGVSSHSAVNGQVTEYSAIGLNLVGLAMLAFAFYCRSQLADWQNRATRGFSV